MSRETRDEDRPAHPRRAPASGGKHPTWLLVPVTALSLALATLGQRVLAVPDAAFHLLQGRILLERGFPGSELLSFASADGRWVLQSWLIDAAYAGVEHLGGLPALHASLVLSVIIVYVVVGLALWRRAPGWPTAGLLVGVFFAATSHLTLRPELVSIAFLVLTIGLAQGWWGRAWYALPLFVIWANVHGLFLAGIVVAIGVWIGRLVDHRLGLATAELRRPALVAASALVGALITPYGVGLWRHLIQLARVAPARLSEWGPIEVGTTSGAAFLVMFSLVLLVVTQVGRVRLEDALLLLFALALGVSSNRNDTIATVLTAVAGAPYLAEMFEQWGIAGTARTLASGVGHAVAVVSTVAALGLAGIALGGPSEIEPHVPAGLPTAHIEALPNGSRLLTPTSIAPYASLLRWPEVEIGIDGRLDVYEIDVFDRLRRALENGPALESTLDEYRVSHVLAPADAAVARTLDRTTGWRISQSTGGYATFVRTELDLSSRADAVGELEEESLESERFGSGLDRT